MKKVCLLFMLVVFVTCVSFKDKEMLSVDSLAKQAHEYYQEGDYEKAERLYLQLLKIRKKLSPEGKHPDYADTLHNLAYLYVSTSNYSKAEPLYLQLLEIEKTFSPAGRHLDYAATLYKLAVLYYVMDKYSRAEFFGLQALEINRTYPPEGKNPAYAITLQILGNIYLSIGNYTKAETLHLQALEIVKVLPTKGKRREYAASLNDLAVLYKIMGNYSKAELFCLQALDIFKTLPSEGIQPSYLITLNNLAVVYDSMGNYSKAEALHLQALEINKTFFPEGKHPDYASTLHNLAALYDSMGNYGQAEALYLQALEIRKAFPPESKHPDYANTLDLLGLLYQKTGNYSKAEPLYLQALEIRKTLPPAGKNPDFAAALHKMASLYDCMEQYDKAESFFIQSLSQSRELLQSNLMALSENEKAKFVDTLFPRFLHFYSFLEKRLPANAGLAGTAVNFRLFHKAVIFRSVKKIRERILQRGDEELNNDFHNWLMLRSQINRVYELTDSKRINQFASLNAWEEEANRLEKKLSSRSEDFRLAYEQKEFTWQDIRAALRSGEAAVEMVRYPVFKKQWTDVVHYAAIIIKPDSVKPEILFLENGAILESEVSSLYRNFMKATVNNSIANQDKETYHTLYTRLWAPLAARLDKVKRIYFSPDGIYHFINPATLQTSDGKWLDDRWDVVRITALQDIVEKKQQRNVSASAPVLVGYPDYSLDGKARQLLVKQQFRDPGAGYERITYQISSALAPLPGTREEVTLLAQLFRDKEEAPAVWLGKEAMEEKVKQVKSPRVLHLATHAFFQDNTERQKHLQGRDTDRIIEDPLLRSGLLFCGADRTLQGEEVPAGLENGILTAREAVDLELEGTELVVLSACDTGLGLIRNGEGVYGLQRAFLVAGADAVLMSLWRVDDAAARDFMVEFYTRWLAGRSKQEAYRGTVAWMKTKYPAPFYWGAFVLVGWDRDY